MFLVRAIAARSIPREDLDPGENSSADAPFRQ